MRRNPTQLLSWEETFSEMARECEDWSNFDAVLSDGLEAQTASEPAHLTPSPRRK